MLRRLPKRIGVTDPAGSEGIHRARSLSEGAELRFSNQGEKTCETLGGRFAMLNFAIKTKAKPNGATNTMSISKVPGQSPCLAEAAREESAQ